MRTRLMIGASALALGLMLGCGGESTTSTNTNTSDNVAKTAETAEYIATTSTDGGVTTETRVYKNNPRVSKVIITTRDGKRTARVVSASGEEKELRTDDLDDVLRRTGDEIAKAAGFVADKAEDVGGKAADVGREVGDKGEDVVQKAGEGAKKVGEKTVEGAKTVGNKTVQGAKKTGSAIKDAVTP